MNNQIELACVDVRARVGGIAPAAAAAELAIPPRT
jgi:hypothetical protein